MASSFMNPMESRSGQNLNRVRIFGADKLSKVTLDDKWDRVKVVCTQPFHKVDVLDEAVEQLRRKLFIRRGLMQLKKIACLGSLETIISVNC